MSGERLTEEEERVIVKGGTEPPFSGKYNEHFEQGTYVCRRCGAPLYRSDDKFRSDCGWPSFDAEIPGAVRRVPDPDGRRTEIRCAGCGGHLGHVFQGEGYTHRDTRHCVNSLSMGFQPDGTGGKRERAIFAGGCFWGVEYHLRRIPGVLSTRVGYTGGATENPTYEEVCSHGTGHAEAVEIVFDPEKVSFRELARAFFEIHDPTQQDRQGPDIGTQYRSAAFYTGPEQKKVLEDLIQQLRGRGYDVKTVVMEAGKFWPAEDWHQDYYTRKGAEPYCHIPVKRFGRDTGRE